MSTNVIQPSMSGGELSPSLFARVDLAKYHSGMATMRNFFVDYRSGASSRFGTKFIIQAFKSSTAVRLIPFQTSVLVPYILEFGDGYIRPISNGASVLEAAFNIIGATDANPVVINVPGHNYTVGDWVWIQGVVGETELNNKYYMIKAITGNLLSLADVNGVPINGLDHGSYINGGTVARVYMFTSPYAAADLALLKYVQITNTMYLVHPNYPPKILTFVSPTNWTIQDVVFGATTAAPTGQTATPTTGGGVNFAYVITAVDSRGEESVASSPARCTSINIGTTAGSITVAWSAVTGAVSYNVYKAELSYAGAVPTGAAYGFIGSCTGVSFVDSNIVPDFTTPPPTVANPFSGGNNPGAICFFQQRLYYAASQSLPQTFWASQPGLYQNFNISDPTQADDAITDTLVSLQVNAIRSMLPMPGGLIFFTAKGAWQLSSGSGVASTSAVTPINATATPQAYNGCSNIQPLIINNEILFVQDKGAIVRDLSYNIYANIYTGTDISILSNHLFYGRQIREWAYAEEPFKIVWAIRDDGILLSLTYLKEQEMYGWARHDTLGLFKSVASVTEGQVDAVYFVVQRYINGRWVQMIERMADRQFVYGAEDSWCVDCGLQSPLITPNANLTASASTGSATFNADANVFSASSVGQALRMGGGIANITQYISPMEVIGTITQTITQTLPNDPNETPVPATSGNWSITPKFTEFKGLDYLEGQTVSILADGSVITPQVVSNGTITLQQPASKVTVGLKFTAQLQSMYLDIGGGQETVQGKRKKISALTVRVRESRGLLAGTSFDDSVLVPIKELSDNTTLDETMALITSDERVIMDPLWQVPGQICLQLEDPLPSTVLGIIPEIEVGDTK